MNFHSQDVLLLGVTENGVFILRAAIVVLLSSLRQVRPQEATL